MCSEGSRKWEMQVRRRVWQRNRHNPEPVLCFHQLLMMGVYQGFRASSQAAFPVFLLPCLSPDAQGRRVAATVQWMVIRTHSFCAAPNSSWFYRLKQLISSASLAKGLNFSHFSSTGGRGTKDVKPHRVSHVLFITILSLTVLTSLHPITEHTCFSKIRDITCGTIIKIPCSEAWVIGG